MIPEKLVCPRCGNTVWFREWALRYTVQPFEIPEGGAYDEAEWGCFDPGEETFPMEILCDAEPCRGLPPTERTAVWRHPNLEAAERVLAAGEELLASGGGVVSDGVAEDPGRQGSPGGVP
jgi:hypothetical protein